LSFVETMPGRETGGRVVVRRLPRAAVPLAYVVPPTESPFGVELGAVSGAPPAPGTFRICLGSTAGARRSARELVERRYSWRGYSVTQHADPAVCTFVAAGDGDAVVGTVGVRVEARAPLAAETLYRDELAGLRSAGARLCEFTRLALDVRNAGKPVLARLFHSAYLYAALLCGATHAVIEVNPRHVRFYERALGFERVGVERMNDRVEAPAVLLAASFADVAAAVADAKARPASDHNLYPFGWSPSEERRVVRRLERAMAGAADDAVRRVTNGFTERFLVGPVAQAA
jgi:hypothetical protein